jgi:aerobic-type carbon monoxide dehydrogenase small subunit (CoxS/CutS family)
MRHEIVMTLNGDSVPIDVQSGDVLLDVLRTRLGVKSPKIGCERGDCGTCTVLLDGKTVRSCLVLAVEADGHEVTTVEGIEHDGLTAVQEMLIDHGSFQCGFCAPGIVLAAAELLDATPDPTAQQVREAISGNLCRCTGYEPIIEAVLAAADSGGRS